MFIIPLIGRKVMIVHVEPHTGNDIEIQTDLGFTEISALNIGRVGLPAEQTRSSYGQAAIKIRLIS